MLATSSTWQYYLQNPIFFAKVRQNKQNKIIIYLNFAVETARGCFTCNCPTNY